MNDYSRNHLEINRETILSKNETRVNSKRLSFCHRKEHHPTVIWARKEDWLLLLYKNNKPGIESCKHVMVMTEYKCSQEMIVHPKGRVP